MLILLVGYTGAIEEGKHALKGDTCEQKKYRSTCCPGRNYQAGLGQLVPRGRRGFGPTRALELRAPRLRAGEAGGRRVRSPRDSPGLQRHVAVQHPAVLELHRLGRGGQVIGRGGRGVDLTPPVGQRVPVEGVGGRVVMRQRVVVRGWQRGPQSRLAVVVWRTWKRRRRNGRQGLPDAAASSRPGAKALTLTSAEHRQPETQGRPHRASQGQLLRNSTP